jgi:preprotein translocase subunit SecG
MNPFEPQHSREDGLSTSYTGSFAGRLFKDDARFALGRITVFQYVTVAIFGLLLVGFFYIIKKKALEWEE